MENKQTLNQKLKELFPRREGYRVSWVTGNCQCLYVEYGILNVSLISKIINDNGMVFYLDPLNPLGPGLFVTWMENSMSNYHDTLIGIAIDQTSIKSDV